MPWPKETKYLGKSTPRAEGPAKVSGRAKFTTDVAPAGVLFGAILRSTWAAARIKAIDLTAAQAAPGIKAALLVHNSEYLTRYYGDELAALAGTSRQAVLDALRLIKVDAEPLPFVVKELDAIKPDAAQVFAGRPNQGNNPARDSGRPDDAFAAAAAVVEGTFATQIELHHPMEPHAYAVSFEGDEMTAWASTQGVFAVRDGYARSLGLPQNKVRVICEHMGGGFGAKSSLSIEGELCAKLAQAAGAPVKLVLTRFEESLATGNRPSSFQKLKLAADKDGKLTAFQMEGFGTPGYMASAPTGGGSNGVALPMPYLYRVPSSRVKQSAVAINAGVACAMRAPAHPPAAYGMEGILDDLAVKLGLDPVAIRLLNDPSEVRRHELEVGAEKFGWKAKYQKPGSSPGPVKVGIGCASAAWMSGGRGTQAEAQISSDGTVEIRVGTQDLGTGSRTVVQVVAAEMLGIDPALVTARVGDTRFPPSGGSGGSATTASVSPAIFDLCEKAVEDLKKTSGLDDPRGANWKAACAKIGATPLAVTGRWRDGLSTGGAGGVQFAEVEVDTETGFVKLRKILAVHDCGTVVNKLTCESQINGGVIMGIGYALYEQRVMDRRSGVLLNPNFETYKLPGIGDIPEIELMLLDMPERGVIGIGEPCTVPTAAAIANAVANALGVRVPSLPITPDKVLTALGQVPDNGDRAAQVRDLDGAFARVAGAERPILLSETPA